jgi:glycosyltransferase involved in cell wall biosynthesis
VNATLRNAPCPCGSGLRYKSCHGRVEGDGPGAVRDRVAGFMREAIDAQRARRLDRAEALYRRALTLAPDDADALHMLGMIRHERGDRDEALSLILRALDLSGWRIPFMRSNLGLVLSRGHEATHAALLRDVRARYEAMLVAREARRVAVRPLVSVVVASYRHEAYVERALASIEAQEYANLEIVVVDDGSPDASGDLIERSLAGSRFPHRVVRRANRGAPATLNEGAALARGDWLQFLNSDDALAPRRIARMVDAVAAIGAEWGFSRVLPIDDRDAPADPMRDRRAYDILCAVFAVPLKSSVGLALLDVNVAVSSGNLFVARTLFERVGGFRDFRYNHDWDFALRALQEAEPVFVDEPLYRYRLHGANTIRESRAAPREEAYAVTTAYLDWALAAATPRNPFAPASSTWGPLFANNVLSGGLGAQVEPARLRAMALDEAARRAVPAEARA